MQVYTVGQITTYLKELLESDTRLADLWVSGEVSNLFKSQAEHLYFTLKDVEGQLRCVFFKKDRLDLGLENGMAVVAHGRLSVYELRGEFQFYVDLVQPEGVGLLHLEYQRLKAKLEEEGLFEPARKRPLPPFPDRIGVVTSPVSAAFHDIINVISRRYPLVEIVLSPTLVQGDGAAEGIVQALRALNDTDGIDLVILARGGGSLEELWAFNEEEVARAIYSSRAPLITGVGHDTDFTIADFVADLRAPTPSAAAELAVPDRWELSSRIQSYQGSLLTTLLGELSQKRDKMRYAIDHLKAPDLSRYRQHIDDLCHMASTNLGGFLALKREELRSRSSQLGSLSPLSTLSRGYALVQKPSTGEIVSRVGQVEKGDAIDIQVSDGGFSGKVTGKRKGNGRQGTLL